MRPPSHHTTRHRPTLAVNGEDASRNVRHVCERRSEGLAMLGTTAVQWEKDLRATVCKGTSQPEFFIHTRKQTYTYTHLQFPWDRDMATKVYHSFQSGVTRYQVIWWGTINYGKVHLYLQVILSSVLSTTTAGEWLFKTLVYFGEAVSKPERAKPTWDMHIKRTNPLVQTTPGTQNWKK